MNNDIGNQQLNIQKVDSKSPRHYTFDLLKNSYICCCENDGQLICRSCFRQLLNFLIQLLFNRICRSSSEADKSKLEVDSALALFWVHFSRKYRLFIFFNIHTLLKSLWTMQEISWEIEQNKREKFVCKIQKMCTIISSFHPCWSFLSSHVI